MGVCRQRSQVSVAKATSNRGCRRRGPHGALDIARGPFPKHLRQQQVSTLHTVIVVLEQSVGAREPAAATAHLPPHEELHTDPKGQLGRAASVTRFHVTLMCALPRTVVLLLAPRHEQRRAKPLQVARLQRLSRVSVAQRLRGFDPGSGVIRLTTTPYVVHRFHRFRRYRSQSPPY